MKAVTMVAGSLIRIDFPMVEGLRTVALVDNSGTSCSVFIDSVGIARHFPIVDTMRPEPIGLVADWVGTRVDKADKDQCITAWRGIGLKHQLDYLSKVRAFDWMIREAHFDPDAAEQFAVAELAKIREGMSMVSAVADNAQKEAKAR